MRQSIFILCLTIISIYPATAQTRKQQPVPTYTIEIRGKGTVTIEGSYETPQGKRIEIEHHAGQLPVNLYLNADCHLLMKITGEERFTVTVLYEYREVSEWLATYVGIPGTGVSLNLTAKPTVKK